MTFTGIPTGIQFASYTKCLVYEVQGAKGKTFTQKITFNLYFLDVLR